jgi:hypothetical protein
MNFPLSYVALELGLPPESTIVVAFFVGVCCLILRLVFLRKMVGLSMAGYLKNVCLNVFVVTVLTVIPTFVVYTMFPERDWIQFLSVGMISVVASILAILYVGCSASERQFFFAKVRTLKSRFAQ